MSNDEVQELYAESMEMEHLTLREANFQMDDWCHLESEYALHTGDLCHMTVTADGQIFPPDDNSSVMQLSGSTLICIDWFDCEPVREEDVASSSIEHELWVDQQEEHEAWKESCLHAAKIFRTSSQTNSETSSW